MEYRTVVLVRAERWPLEAGMMLYWESKMRRSLLNAGALEATIRFGAWELVGPEDEPLADFQAWRRFAFGETE